MKECAKVSVIVPVYGTEKYVTETLESVLVQTYANVEIVCVDDQSPDDSFQILLDYAQRYESIQVVQNEKNLGLAASRNQGIKHACGKFILPLDSDDVIHPEYISEAVIHFLAKPSTAVVYCEAKKFTESREWYWYLAPYSRRGMVCGNRVFCSGVYRRSDWELYGGYDPGMKHGLEDWEFWMNFVSEGREFYRIPRVLFAYRQVEGSMVRSMCTMKEKSQAMLNRVQKKNEDLFKYRGLWRFMQKVGRLFYKEKVREDRSLVTYVLGIPIRGQKVNIEWE